jgi:hypothetical protein
MHDSDDDMPPNPSMVPKLKPPLRVNTLAFKNDPNKNMYHGVVVDLREAER